jgi:hypothetical protein
MASQQYPSTPKAVVGAYCAADATGARLKKETLGKTDAYVAGDSTWWNVATVISNYYVIWSKVNGDHAKVWVAYRIQGRYLQGWEPLKTKQWKTEIFSLELVDGKWKILSPGLEPRIILRAVAPNRETKPADLAQIFPSLQFSATSEKDALNQVLDVAGRCAAMGPDALEYWCPYAANVALNAFAQYPHNALISSNILSLIDLGAIRPTDAEQKIFCKTATPYWTFGSDETVDTVNYVYKVVCRQESEKFPSEKWGPHN